MPTDTSEKGLEALIVKSLVEEAGYLPGLPEVHDLDHALDLNHQLLAFLEATQPKAVESLNRGNDGPYRQQFLHRLQGEVTKRGVIDVLRRESGVNTDRKPWRAADRKSQRSWIHS